MAIFNSYFDITRGYHKIIDEKMDVSTGSHIQIIQRQASVQWWWEQRSHRGRDSHSFWSAECSVLVRDYPDWLSSPPVSHIEMEDNHEIGGNSGNPVTPVTQLPTCLFSISPSYPRQMICICKSFWVFRMWMHWMANKNGGKQPLGYQGMLHPNAGFPWVWCYPVLQTFELHISYQNKSEKMVTKTFKPVFFLWYPILTHTYCISKIASSVNSNQSSRVRNQGHVFWTRNSVPCRILNPIYELAKWNTIT